MAFCIPNSRISSTLLVVRLIASFDFGAKVYGHEKRMVIVYVIPKKGDAILLLSLNKPHKLPYLSCLKLLYVGFMLFHIHWLHGQHISPNRQIYYQY